MAITFLEKRKRLRYLFPILAFVVFITIIILWRGFFSKEEAGQIAPESFIQPAKNVEINTEALKNPLLEEFQPFEDIDPFEGGVGRQNPFISF